MGWKSPAPGKAAVTCPCPPRQVLKILLHTCSQGSPQFVLQLKRNASFIREAAGNGLGDMGEQQQPHGNPRRAPAAGAVPGTGSYPTWEHPPPGSIPHLPLCVSAVFSGPPDPLHGNSLNQKVRAAAQVGAGVAEQPSAPPLGLPVLPTLLSPSPNPTGPGQHSVLGCAAAAAPGAARPAPGPCR